MEGHEYVYRMKPLLFPGLGYLIGYPVLVGIVSYLFLLPEAYLRMFSWIYIVSAVVILVIWLTAKTKKIMIDGHSLTLSSFAGKKIIQPQDIRKISFYWTKRNEELVQIRVGKKIYYFSNLYFPFNELMTDIEEFILAHHIRSNLANHYGMSE